MTTIYTAHDFVMSAWRELRAEILAGRPVDELAEELGQDETSGGVDLDDADIEAALWTLVLSELTACAEAAGAAAVTVGDESILPTWPRDASIDVEGIVAAAKIKGTLRGSTLSVVCEAFRTAYATAAAVAKGEDGLIAL